MTGDAVAAVMLLWVTEPLSLNFTHCTHSLEVSHSCEVSQRAVIQLIWGSLCCCRLISFSLLSTPSKLHSWWRREEAWEKADTPYLSREHSLVHSPALIGQGSSWVLCEKNPGARAGPTDIVASVAIAAAAVQLMLFTTQAITWSRGPLAESQHHDSSVVHTAANPPALTLCTSQRRDRPTLHSLPSVCDGIDALI